MKRNATVWTLGLLTIFLFASMAYYLRDLKPSIVAAQLSFSREGFESVLSCWPPEQVQRFSRHFAVDYVFLVVYGAFGWRLGRQLNALHPTPNKVSLLLPWLLPTAAVFDCAENVLHQTFLSHPNGVLECAYFAAGLAALSKWCLTLVFIVLAVSI